MAKKEINTEDLLFDMETDLTNFMDKYIKKGFLSKNKELFFEDEYLLDRYEHYANGLKALILDTYNIPYELRNTKYGTQIYIDEPIDEMKLAEDNARADLEAQDYDTFGEYKI